MRGLLKVIKWGLLGLLLLVASWVAFNGPWADAPARPRPAVLLQKPLQPSGWSAYALLVDKPMRIDIPAEAPWKCGSHSTMDCTAVWLEQSAALRQQLKGAGAFAAACEAAAAKDIDWTEPEVTLPAVNPAAKPIPQYKNISWCVRWLRAQATLAVVDGDDARALQYLHRADAAVRGLLDGAQSLLGHGIAWAMAIQQWQSVAVLAHARPKLAGRMLDLLEPLHPAALSTTRWISTESAFSNAINRDLRRSCEATIAGTEEYPNQGWLTLVWCRGHLGYLPELTSQELDAQFLALVEQTREGAVAAVTGQNAPAPEPSLWAWRNTLGHPMVGVTAKIWWPYVKRQADVELVRQAALLAVQMGSIAAADRGAWLQSQTIQAGLRERIRLDGSALIVRGWAEGAEDLHIPLASAENH